MTITDNRVDHEEDQDLSQEDNIFIDMCQELERATEKYGEMHSAHEAMGIIEEEFHEFKLEVYKKITDKEAMRGELIQIGAMCARAIIDLELED